MASADDEIMRLKAELSAVKSRAVGKIKQQAQQISEHEATIKSLKEQLAEKESETPTSGPSSEDGDKERFVKIGRGAGRTDEDELRRREEAVQRREEQVQAREQALQADELSTGQEAPAWHLELIEGLEKIRTNLASGRE